MTLALAVAIHTDWHFARPAHHRLSLGLTWHWLLAIPVFALAAWYVARTWPSNVARMSMGILGTAIVIAGVLEPAWEYWLGDAPFDWAFGTDRTLTLAAFTGTGLLAYLTVVWTLRRTKESIGG